MRRGAASLAGLVGMLATHALAQPEVSHSRSQSASIGPALVSPVQGSEGVREAYETRIRRAVEAALEERGVVIRDDRAAGLQVVACGSPDCVEAALGRAGVTHAVVPAMWVRSRGRRELTLTLVGKSGRNVNAGTVLNGDLSSTTEILVRHLVAKHARALDLGGLRAEDSFAEEGGVRVHEPRLHAQRTIGSDDSRSGAWMAGPVALWIGGAATIATVGALAAMKDDTQSLNGGALAGWLLVGGSALGGGAAWWVLGRRRRQQSHAEHALHVSPRGFDLRVRF